MKKLLIAILITAASFIHLSTVSAQSKQVDISIFPAISEFSIDQGDSREVVLQVQNNTQVPLPVSLKTRPMSNQGSAIAETLPEKYDASAWLNIEDESLILKPKLITKIKTTITVPNDASPGGHYAQVVIRPLSSIKEDQSNVAIIPEIAANIFISTPGEVENRFSLINIQDLKTITPAAETAFSAIARNDGNIHDLVNVQIAIKKEGAVVQQHFSAPQLVLPSTERAIEIKLPTKDLNYGEYDIEWTLNYADQSDNYQSKLRVQPETWQLVLAAVGGAITIFIAARWRKIPEVIGILKGDIKIVKGNYRLRESSNNHDIEIDENTLNSTLRSIEQERQILGLPSRYQRKVQEQKIDQQKANQSVKESVDSEMQKLASTKNLQNKVNVTKTDSTKTTIIENKHTMIVRDEPIKKIESVPQKKKINIKFD